MKHKTMNQKLVYIHLSAAFILAPCMGCTDDSDGDNSITPPDFSTETGISGETTLDDLNLEQARSLCEIAEVYIFNQFSVEDNVHIECTIEALYRSDSDITACEEEYSACTATAKEDIDTQNYTCSDWEAVYFQGCPATIEDIEACYTELAQKWRQIGSTISCSYNIDTLDQELEQRGDTCQNLEQKCPHFFDDYYEGTSNDTSGTSNGTWDTSNGTSGTSNGTWDTSNGTSGTSNEPVQYRFVLIEDQSPTEREGDSPGSDIDAVSVTSDGVEFFAVRVEDFSLGGGTNLDVDQALGAPDSDCEAVNFVSLGGEGYLVVSFGVAFESGDAITVYELGPTLCPERAQWIDNDYRVSVSVSTDLSDFIEVGEGGAGINTLIIP
ncbi:MAG: hypothetical protein AAFX99_26470 [Myxococcota bacterium]